MLVDTHAHIQFTAFKDEYKEVLQRAKEAGVLVINVGTQIDTSKEAVRVAEENDIYAVVGLHPVHTYSQHVDEEESHFKTREEKFDYEAYKKFAQNPKVVGIGECGLDYYRLSLEGAPLEKIKKLQKDVFVEQIRLAKELNKALVIHCRPSPGSQDAYQDILGILDDQTLWRHSEADGGIPLAAEESHEILRPSGAFGTQDDAALPRFEIHSFTGSPEIVQEFLKRGAYVGLNGIITFDKTGNMQKVVETVPLDRIVLETDAPYLTPVPHRGKKNEPAYVQYVAQKIAEIKRAAVEEVEKQTTLNASRLFGINVGINL